MIIKHRNRSPVLYSCPRSSIGQNRALAKTQVAGSSPAGGTLIVQFSTTIYICQVRK